MGRKLSREVIAEIYRLASSGLNYPTIGKMVGCSRSCVQSYIHKNRVEITVVVPEYPVVDGVAFAPIPEFPGYVVGSDGSVWSKHRKSFHRVPGWYSVKTIGPDKYSRYVRVGLRKDNGKGRAVSCYVHQLVLMSFQGPRPKDMQCRHYDGDETNNRLDNLIYGTAVENSADKKRHGTEVVGSRHKNSKLTEDIVRKMRELYKLGRTQLSLANEFGVRQTTVSKIVRNVWWKHVV